MAKYTHFFGIHMLQLFLTLKCTNILQQLTVPRTLYLHGHLVVSALQEGGKVSQSNVFLPKSVVHADDVRLAIVLTCCQ